MARTLEPEDRIAHYRIVGPLGAGGMGEVYIAQDEKLERNVALKILPPHLVRNEERVRRFVTEAKSASSLNHPNIVTIHDIGHDHVRTNRTAAAADPPSDAVHFIAMELVAGETLDAKIHHEKADLRTLLGHLAQAAEGVAKAHAAGIVHRDLKPGNIMVSKDGFAKVLDFGLAKLTERASVVAGDQTSAPTAAPPTGEGVVMGTVGYMSPEQVQGKTVDHRSDIFSLGCILDEAATRRRPFVADSDVEVMHQILKDKPPPVEQLNPRRCLAKAPDQRFQSMKDVAVALTGGLNRTAPKPASSASLQDLNPASPNYYALFQVPSLGGTPRKVVFDVDSAASFSPDGKHACFRRGLLDARIDSIVIAGLESEPLPGQVAACSAPQGNDVFPRLADRSRRNRPAATDPGKRRAVDRPGRVGPGAGLPALGRPAVALDPEARWERPTQARGRQGRRGRDPSQDVVMISGVQ